MTPPRLQVLTAPGSAAAVGLRRAPAGAAATLGWDRDNHAFTPTQWLRGRIHEHRADLSPDGRHMVYFASRRGQAWTAVSRAPWLRAVLFRPQTGTWGGGGAFDERGRLWLNGAVTPPDLAEVLGPAPRDAYPHSTDGFHMGDTYAAMQERRGWRRSSPGVGYNAELSRDLPGGGRIVQSFVLQARNRSIVSSRYALVTPAGARIEKPEWEWAEPWGDRLHFAAKGALWEMPAEARAPEARRLHDFAGMGFEPHVAAYEGAVA